MVAILLPPETPKGLENSLEELSGLVSTLGGTIVGTVIQKRHSPDPAYFIGKGKAETIAEKVIETGASLVAFDNELTGTQQKNLEKIVNCRVIDRTGVILDIFSNHARSKEAKNQVEIAKLQYLASRLTRRWTHLERQQGGIGLRGIGEKQIELDRRQIRGRIAKLKKELKHTSKNRENQRTYRDKYLRVAIVGYTNAGKSTIMNNLTTSQVYVDDRVFATLDSTVRIIDPKTRPPILLTDTVGFIRKLPHGLVASFRSTLQEVIESDLLLHVVDLSLENYEEQMEVTESVLEEIGAGEKTSFLVFNKVDLIGDFLLPKLVVRKYVDSLAVSAHQSEDMKKLRAAIYGFFERDMLELEVLVPYSNTWLNSQIYEYTKVLERKFMEAGTQMKIRVMRADANRLKLNEVQKS